MNAERPVIVRAVQTCAAAPSQWDAWDDQGRYWYLRFRFGRGTAEQQPSPDHGTWKLKEPELSFSYSGELAGYINLTDFCKLAGLTLCLGLVAFVRARLEEDEAAAEDWHDAQRCGALDRDGGFDPRQCDCGYPARVLREVAAGRALIAAYEPVARNDGPSEPEYAYGWAEGLGMAVRALASFWSDHPDYDKKWSSGHES
jgi:Family of unknown function (DUF6221)